MATDAAVEELLKELAEAKALPARFKLDADRGIDVGRRIQEADDRIRQLEKRAQEAMKTLGCVSSQTRVLYHSMADMLISWHSFKDSL